MTKHRDGVWGMPAVIGVTTATGLLTALLSNGLGDVAGWLSLGIPPAVVSWALLRRRPGSADA